MPARQSGQSHSSVEPGGAKKTAECEAGLPGPGKLVVRWSQGTQPGRGYKTPAWGKEDMGLSGWGRRSLPKAGRTG